MGPRAGVGPGRPKPAEPVQISGDVDVRPIIGVFREMAAAGSKEEPVLFGTVVIDARGPHVTPQWIGLRGIEVVVHGCHRRRCGILVRVRQRVSVELIERIRDAIGRNDVSREWIADHMSRPRRIGPCRQRVVALRAVRQIEEVGEVAGQLLGARGNRSRTRGLAVVVIVAVRVAQEHEELVSPIDDMRNLNRSAVGCGEVVRITGLERSLCFRIRVKDRLLERIRCVDLIRPILVVGCPARRVRAGARHHGNPDASAMPDRRREVRRLDAHFLKHVGVGRRGHLAVDAVVGRAIDRPLIAAHTAERHG